MRYIFRIIVYVREGWREKETERKTREKRER